MELKTVPIEKPADINFILGQSHFIKTIEDLHESIVAETGSGRGILGVIDGMKSKGIETESDIAARKQMLRKFGYKL